MRATLLALSTALLLSACAAPAPGVRNAAWENNAYVLTEPATNY
ncbi:hypothetical protein U0C82_07495 [Fulvimarina sp. 2208YS6-2-32]|uniref:Uncharacterized protein n=1 Tax=Fulvimarina uroteuthidis TaxID=3098149 RepID=A0ABU5I1L7_9HYPH|nr:hypothetical protein [Fulvimarina sp. 2208YS6-2-32]MDY8108985.1 hypothetical protein [Fulvimarina sp. 2208YS6-2-32]